MVSEFDEKELMLSGKLYNSCVDELQSARDSCNELIIIFNSERNKENRKKLLLQLLGKIGENSVILPPFHCDYDCCHITIGNNVLIGPNVQLIGATHPTDPVIRNSLLEYGGPITINDGVWIGAGAIILPNIIIGKNSVIGAGSVVTKNVPENVVVAGNPARVLRKVSEHPNWNKNERDIPIN